MMAHSAKKLRPQLLSRTSNVPQTSGYYRWWFPKKLAISLLSPLPSIDQKNIKKETIGGEEHWLLYFGIAKSLSERMKWHICQKHTPSSVKSGTLSTLRQTISALLQIDQTKAESQVNDTLDQCFVEWQSTPTKEEAEAVEKQELTSGYYPLNIQENKVVPKAIINKLKELRKLHKK